MLPKVRQRNLKLQGAHALKLQSRLQLNGHDRSHLVPLVLHQGGLVAKPRQRNATLLHELQVSVPKAVPGVHIEERKHGEVVRQVETTSGLKLLPAPHEVGAAVHGYRHPPMMM